MNNRGPTSRPLPQVISALGEMPTKLDHIHPRIQAEVIYWQSAAVLLHVRIPPNDPKKSADVTVFHAVA